MTTLLARWIFLTSATSAARGSASAWLAVCRYLSRALSPVRHGLFAREKEGPLCRPFQPDLNFPVFHVTNWLPRSF